MKNILFILIAFFFIFSSCEKKLDIDLPDSDKKIVVNGIVNPDSLMKVRISKSLNVLDNGNVEYLSDAVVKLYKDDVLMEELNNMNSGYFMSSVFPEINANYKLTIDYSGLTSVNSEIQLKKAVNIVSVDTVSEVRINNYGDGYIDTSYIMHFEIKIKDDADKSDYYFLSLRAIIPVYDFIDDEYVIIASEETNMFFESDDHVFRNSEWFTLDGMQGIVFTDEMFNGNEYSFDIEHYIFKNDEFDYKQLGTMYYVKLLTVTEDVFNYISSYNLNQQTLYDPFAQPVQIYSNIENGLGIFSGYTMSVDSLQLDF